MESLPIAHILCTLCANHCPKYLICIISFGLYNNARTQDHHYPCRFIDRDIMQTVQVHASKILGPRLANEETGPERLWQDSKTGGLAGMRVEVEGCWRSRD